MPVPGSLLDCAWSWCRRHPFWLDLITAFAWAVLCVAVPPFVRPSAIGTLVWYASVVLTTGGLALRGTQPRAAVALFALACVLSAAVLRGYTATAVVAALWAAYVAEARLGHRDRRLVLIALLVGTAGAAFAYDPAYVNLSWPRRWPIVVAQWVVVGFFSLLGTLRRKRGEEAEAWRRSQAQDARLATLAERTHIAREMHDVIAHSLGVVIAQADGGRYAAASSPQAAINALEAIGRVARDSLAETRELLQVLRTDHGQDVLAAPGLDDLPALLEDYRRAGLEVHASDVPTDVVLSATTGLVVYRVVQESLANALMHAGQVRADIEFGVANERVCVVVTNPLSSAGSRPAGTGRGLVGMRERVQTRGGHLFAGPDGDQWRVQVDLPTRADEAAVALRPA